MSAVLGVIVGTLGALLVASAAVGESDNPAPTMGWGVVLLAIGIALVVSS